MTWKQQLCLLGLTIVLPGCVSTAPAPDTSNAASDRPPVINSHMHAAYLDMEDAPYREQVLAEMDEHNIVRTVLHISETSDVQDWAEAAPGRFLAGPAFPCVPAGLGRPDMCRWDNGAWPSLGWLRQQYESGVLSIMGELLYVYAGLSPTDARFEPYWALAAELDIPVFVHINRGPPANSPSRPAGCCPDFNADYGNPELLRPVLERYPGLRVVLQHAGFPSMPMLGGIGYEEETYALLRDYDNVYVDMTILNSLIPAPVHEAALREFKARGLLTRIMMGTDNLPAADVIARYEQSDVLTDVERRAILYDNAARFFRISTP